MITDVNIIDLDEGLVVRTRRTPSLAEGVFSAAATGVFGAIAASFVTGRAQAIVLAVLTGAIAFFYTRRTHKFELRITAVGFMAQGKVGDNFGTTRSISASDVQWLEYQEDTSGPETAHHPQGLYAVLSNRSICLLPDVDEQQTSLVIERIKDRFPGLRAQWFGRSSFGKHYISLGLNDEPR